MGLMAVSGDLWRVQAAASLLMFRHPFVGQTLGFVDLAVGHALGRSVTAFLCFVVTLRGRKVKPHMRGNVVLRHDLA